MSDRASAPAAEESRCTIVGVDVLDGERLHQACRVEIAGDRIESVAADGDAPRAGEVIDARGMTLLPGLIDAHVHLLDGALSQAIGFGVTTQLDMSSDEQTVAAARAEARTSHRASDVRSALTGATVPEGHPIPLLAAMGLDARYPTVTTPGEARAFVDRLVAGGADYVKLFLEPGDAFGLSLPTLDGATSAALAAAAHDHGLLAVAHVTSWSAARRAVEAGLDGLAHVPVDGHVDDVTVAALVDSGMFVVPTLAMIEGLIGLGGGRSLARVPRVADRLGALGRATLEAAWPVAPAGADAGTDRFDQVLDSVRTLHEAGVPVLAGTDASVPGTAHGLSLHRELALLVRAGLSSLEAVVAATCRTAETFGLADRGRVAPGLLADLVLVRGDLAADVDRSLDIAAVWRHGRRADQHDQARALGEGAA